MNKPSLKKKIEGKNKSTDSLQKMQDQLMQAKIEGNTVLVRIIEKCIKRVEVKNK